MKFKLIAIRPLEKCNEAYLKVLKEGQVYSFFSRFDFTNYRDDHRVIHIANDPEIDLYTPQEVNGHALSIEASAIVGRNGSGKSTVIELFYAAIYNISVFYNMLFDERIAAPLKSGRRIKDIRVEIFYELEDNIYLIRLDDKKIGVHKSPVGDFREANIVDFDWGSFFYSIAVNYSHYALNSLELGGWINAVFHKNDAYQMPIVINPMRSKGIIDINNENDLVRSRLLSNVIFEEKELRNLIGEKTVKYLKFNLNTKKINQYVKSNFEYTRRYGEMLLPIVYELFLNESEFVPAKTNLNSFAKEYILRKIYIISCRYKPYKSFRKYLDFQKDQEQPDEALIRAYIKELKDDPSHITLKLRQAVYFLRDGSFIKESDLGALRDIEDLSSILKDIKDKTGLKPIELIPPSIFKTEIYFDKTGLAAETGKEHRPAGDKMADLSNHSFERLSSGEKQYIFNLSSLIYHLYNIDSVHLTPRTSSEGPGKLVKYKYVNIIFDEIELYYHPDLQRKFVHDLVKRLELARFGSLQGINLLFITHSPFILSDIPNSHILFLDVDGVPYPGKDIKTFGANIHDLLKQGFFLKQGAMGELAKSKINDTIRYLNYRKLEVELSAYSDEEKVTKAQELADLKELIEEWGEANHKRLIEVIDEPILRQKLGEMYADVVEKTDRLTQIQRQIAVLQGLEKKLLSNSKKD